MFQLIICHPQAVSNYKIMYKMCIKMTLSGKVRMELSFLHKEHNVLSTVV